MRVLNLRKLQAFSTLSRSRTSYRFLSSSSDQDDSKSTPNKASTVIIGGGCAGVSIAYHLAKAGQENVVLLEKTELTAGSTWHAAGLTTFYNPGINMKKIHHYSLRLYDELENETGLAVGLHKCGSLRLAQTPDRVDEFHHQMSRQGWNEAEQWMVWPDEIKQMFPLLKMDTILAGLYNPNDGHIDPYSMTQSLAAGARKYGAKLNQNIEVKSLNQRNDGAWDITTNKGTITADRIVNAAGFWGRQIGQLIGLDHPLVPIHHQYVVTKTVDAVAKLKKEPPVLRDLENSYYLRQERDGILIGPYESGKLMKLCEDWYDDGPPLNFGKELFQSDLDRIQDYVSAAMNLIPVLETAEIQTVVCGPITYTPDLLPMVGPFYGVDNYWCALGLSYGIIHAGGVGKYISDWIVTGEPSYDLIETDPNRYGEWTDKTYCMEKVRESYGMNNSLVVPHEERFAGRPTLRGNTNLYERFKKENKCEFGFKSGWESPLWFHKNGDDTGYKPSFRRTNWFKPVGREVELVMKNVGITDLTPFAKYLIEGNHASAFMNYLTANDLPKRGKIVLSHLLTPNGRVYAEFTISRLLSGAYICISGAGSELHDLRWMETIAKQKNYDVTIKNCTEDYGCLGLAGPKSRDVLQSLCKDFLIDNKYWKFMEVKEIIINKIPVIALRLSYTGELGWELYMPKKHLLKVYDILMEAGKKFGMDNFGSLAINSMRLEKGFRAWGLEMNLDKNPLEAGLDMFIKENKSGDFVGKSAIKELRKSVMEKKLCFLHIDNLTNVDAEGNESVWLNGNVIGNTTSGAYGYNVKTNIAYAYLPISNSVEGTEVEVELLGKFYKAVVKQSPPLLIESLRKKDNEKEN